MTRPPRPAPPPNRVLLVNAFSGQAEAGAEKMGELAELAASAGWAVAGTVMQRREGDGGPFLVGSGKLHELADECVRLGVAAVVTRQDLTPPQQRHLEDRLPCAVLDRTALILDIFSRHARSREGKMQVELARLMYRLPRLRGRGREMSRLGGAGRSAGGGAGGARFTRGPGEQELEYGRRRVRDRISHLKREIEELRKRRSRQRDKRKDRSIPSVVLAGYTNAGKSTLFTALTGVDTLARSQMFSTLDPKAGSVRLPGGGRALISDTVGFISDLPANLRVAFRATLEEMADADAIIHVVDASSPDSGAQVRAVLEEMEALGAQEVPRITVFNKEDLTGRGDARLRALESGEAGALTASAREGTGLDGIMNSLEDLLRMKCWKMLEWRDPQPGLREDLARMGASLHDEAGLLRAWVPPSLLSRISSSWGGKAGQ